MAFETDLIRKSREFVEKFLQDKLSDDLYYHDLKHTREVVEAAEKIGRAENLTDDELETVIIAALFHDTGYYKGSEKHEIISKDIATEFLRDNKIEEKKIADIGGCIIATKLPQRPTNKMEEVLCDADLYHVANHDFFEKSELLRKELAAREEVDIKDRKWRKKSLKFLKKHNFFTPFAKENLLPAKEKNLAKLKEFLEEQQAILTDDNNKSEVVKSIDNGEKSGRENVIKKIKKKPNRGVETLFRTTSRNHVDFSSMADNKANIMISINAIMMSILFSVLFRNFEAYPNLIVPAIILSVVCTLTIIFAILATRPNLTTGVFTKEDIEKRRTNLLFFGNFHKMPLEDYEWGMRRLLEDSDWLYGSMIRDIYFIGKVLGKKYRWLRISYTIFMYGLVISVFAFAVAVFFFPTHII